MIFLTKTKSKKINKGKWFDFKTSQIKEGEQKQKVMKEKPKRRTKEERQQAKQQMKEEGGGIFKRFYNMFLGTKEKRVRQILNAFVIGLIITAYVLYGQLVWDGFVTFWVSSMVLAIRVLAYLVESFGDADLWEEWSKAGASVVIKKVTVIIEYIVMVYGLIMMFNLIYDYRLWYQLGLVEYWIDEVAYSFNSILIMLAILGFWELYADREMLKKDPDVPNKTRMTEEQYSMEVFQLRLKYLFQIVVLIVVPIWLLATIIPYVKDVDKTQFEGFISSYRFEGQAGGGFTTYFGLVFYILFQQPIPMFMIAFMGMASIATIMAQSQGTIGRMAVGVAVAVTAIVPMLFVLSALTGAIPPPIELTVDLALDQAIASFIYGLGLILTYIIAITIMGVFITSSRVLTAGWSPV